LRRRAKGVPNTIQISQVNFSIERKRVAAEVCVGVAKAITDSIEVVQVNLSVVIDVSGRTFCISVVDCEWGLRIDAHHVVERLD